MNIAVPISLLSAIALSACTGATTVGQDRVDSYNDAVDRVEPFIDEILAYTATELTSTPVENSASMTGFFYVEPPSYSLRDDIVGEIDMHANFASGTVSGSMTNLMEMDSLNYVTPIDGSMTYSGTINVGTGSFDDISATATGSLTDSTNTTYSITASLDGDFIRRPNNDLGAVGEISATGISGSTVWNYNGAYVVAE